MIEYINRTIPKQPRESTTGNREYKLYLDIENNQTKTEMKKQKNKSKEVIHYLKQQKIIDKTNKRASQLKYRLEEGMGRALYIIGINDDGTVNGIDIETLLQSLTFLFNMSEIIKVKIKKIRIYKGNDTGKYVATIRIENPNYIPQKLLTNF
jgi:GTPase